MVQGADIHGFDDAPLHDNTRTDIFHFTKKNVYSLKNNPMCGVCFSEMIKILTDHWDHIEWCYMIRVIFLIMSSIFNSFLRFIESILYPDSMIEKVLLPDDPVFIIGHPRTGTTLLHNLLASDQANFYTCTTFATGFPSCFLWFETIGKRLFAGTIDATRPMDSMPLHFDLPQEDECATTLLTGGLSYYMPIYLMTKEPSFRQYLDFSHEDGATRQSEAQWTKQFLYLLKKLTLRKEMMKLGSKLLLKSPIHAARVPLLRKLFPKARFIYIHRDPYQVLSSSAHLANTAFWYMYLSTPTNEQVNEYIFWQFEAMWKKYNVAAQDQSSALHRRVHSDIIEVSYVDLVKMPLDTLERIYSHANIQWNEQVASHYQAEIDALASYQVNKLPSLSPALKLRIERAASGYMDAFNYKLN